MKIAQIMTTHVVTIGFDDTLAKVKEIFERLHFHHLLVVEGKKLFGVVSDRDLLKSLSPNLGTPLETPKDAASLNRRVHQIMSRKPIALGPDASLRDAIAVFNEHRISCIPIVDSSFHPIGIVTWHDILKAFQSDEALLIAAASRSTIPQTVSAI